MDPDQRVVAIQRTARTTSGRVVEVNEITLPAHQWELVYEWPAEYSHGGRRLRELPYARHTPYPFGP